MNNSDSWLLYVLFPVTSLAGLANLLRSGQPLTKRAICSVMLNSGLFGISVAAIMLHKFGSESLMLIVAVSILSGLGGNAAIDFGLATFKAVVRTMAAGATQTKTDTSSADNGEK